jgi:transcriptional regulator with XRE-family HTH domain
MIDAMVSGDLLREARLRAGLTQVELAQRVGTARSQISRYERGDVLPSLETLRRLIRACGLELGFRIFNADLEDHDATLIAQTLPLTAEERVDRAVRSVRRVYAP